MKIAILRYLPYGLGLLACGGDGGAGPSQTELAGSWTATRMEFVSVANPATKVEVIALGGQLTVQLTAAGAYTSTVTFPGEAPEVTTGTWNVSVDAFTLRWSEGGFTGEMQFDFTLSGSTLTLTGADSDFDFNEDGVEDAAKLNLILVRQ